MSYSRSYSGNVPYSGTVRYSYPASEHGGSGTAYYSGSVPVSVFLHVDTTPFDYSVNRCNNSVGYLNGAVVSMNAAQCASIKQGAEDVATHVTGGFFSLIKSELTQEMAAVFSKFHSIYELLADRRVTLEKQQLVMKNDYDRTSTRYHEIFTNLDEELRKRVIELDKRAMEISKKVKTEQLNTNVAKSVATFLTGVSEDQIVNSQLTIANTNRRCEKVMETLAGNVIQEQIYAKSISRMVSGAPIKEAETEYVPVVFAESDDFSQVGGKNGNCYVTSDLSNTGITAQVSNYFESNPTVWHSIDSNEKAAIDNTFNSLAEQNFVDGDEKSKRIYEMIMFLKNQNDVQSV